MVKGFSTVFDTETTACARGKDLRCSPKHSRNIVRRIKGMRIGQAKSYLEEVIAKKTPVPMVVRNRKVHHRRGGIGPGGFPVKAADRVLSVLVNAENNAEYKGLETDDLRIIHASAYVGETQFRFKPRAQGRATAFNEQCTNVEIVVGKSEELDAREETKAARTGGAKKGGAKKAGVKKTAKKAPAKAAEAEPAAPAAKKEAGEKKPAAKKAPSGGAKKAAEGGAKKAAPKKTDEPKEQEA